MKRTALILVSLLALAGAQTFAAGDLSRNNPEEVVIEMGANAGGMYFKPNHLEFESYGQIWCMPMKSSGDLVLLFDLFSINEFHTCDDLCQVCEAA